MNDLLAKQTRIVLRRVGKTDPEKIEYYLAYDGYKALEKAIKQLTPPEVIEEISRSGLRGRGGAGFPTGTKWKFVRSTVSDQRYIVCNADESEPGAFKDRLILENDPHSIIEAMLIAGYACGATEGFIYIRGEYKLCQERVRLALQQAQEFGFLGENILGTDFSFHIHLHVGAGGYVCGEETALIESIEGKRAEPRRRPPYPTTSGLWGKPTVVNNVETLANVAPILLNGADWYQKIGTEKSKGTKVFTLLGHIQQRGFIEVPMGTTMREIVDEFAGGMLPGSTMKLAMTGGSSGSIVPASLQDVPLAYEAFQEAGIFLGSGSLLICDQSTCIVDLVRVVFNFFSKESCGRCAPCRIGSRKGREILTRIAAGEGRRDDVDNLAWFASHLTEGANCGLGNAIGIPLSGAIKYFREEIEAHIEERRCPASVCRMQTVPTLQAERYGVR
jgi:NADP-reducing hydrogenase subunit HndC